MEPLKAICGSRTTKKNIEFREAVNTDWDAERAGSEPPCDAQPFIISNSFSLPCVSRLVTIDNRMRISSYWPIIQDLKLRAFLKGNI
ncbi:uncharacterized protein ARMOST_09379 [Armillaria ostoyae]|uniref:Uncharacterized protein n=1 Tax=Armillaria ostoyae TaxID=47428 RepID=A0A284RBC0_ARMOS|nr:uncharacterized protein ARMOST_09379 [Armillaria ostoyae]